MSRQFVSNTLYSLCLTGDFVTQSASSHFPPCVFTRPPREGLVCLSSSPLLCAPRAPLLVPFRAAASLLVAFPCNTTHRYGWQTENETPRHTLFAFSSTEGFFQVTVTAFKSDSPSDTQLASIKGSNDSHSNKVSLLETTSARYSVQLVPDW